MDFHRSQLNLARGLKGAFYCAAVGIIAPPLIMFVFSVARWFWEGAPMRDRLQDLHWLQASMLWPIVGCAIVCACAGWATFAPNGTYRFARSLAIIFAISVPLWIAIGSMQLTPRHSKSVDDPVIYPSELLLILGPPILAAAWLTAMRVRNGSKSRQPQ